jgi:hypothetical protein
MFLPLLVRAHCAVDEDEHTCVVRTTQEIFSCSCRFLKRLQIKAFRRRSAMHQQQMFRRDGERSRRVLPICSRRRYELRPPRRSVDRGFVHRPPQVRGQAHRRLAQA